MPEKHGNLVITKSVLMNLELQQNCSMQPVKCKNDVSHDCDNACDNDWTNVTDVNIWGTMLLPEEMISWTSCRYC